MTYQFYANYKVVTTSFKATWPQKLLPLVTTGLLGVNRHFQCNSNRSLISALAELLFVILKIILLLTVPFTVNDYIITATWAAARWRVDTKRVRNPGLWCCWPRTVDGRRAKTAVDVGRWRSRKKMAIYTRRARGDRGNKHEPTDSQLSARLGRPGVKRSSECGWPVLDDWCRRQWTDVISATDPTRESD